VVQQQCQKFKISEGISIKFFISIYYVEIHCDVIMLDSSSGERITFKDFLAVFINHKPVMDLDASLIQQAFSVSILRSFGIAFYILQYFTFFFSWSCIVLCIYSQALGSDPRTGRLKLEQLLHILQTEGEQMTRYDS
jgi:hypothetical protein